MNNPWQHPGQKDRNDIAKAALGNCNRIENESAFFIYRARQQRVFSQRARAIYRIVRGKLEIEIIDDMSIAKAIEIEQSVRGDSSKADIHTTSGNVEVLPNNGRASLSEPGSTGGTMSPPCRS